MELGHFLGVLVLCSVGYVGGDPNNVQEDFLVGFRQVDEIQDGTCELKSGDIPYWLKGHFVKQTCGSFGDFTPGEPPVTYVEHVFDCVGMATSYKIDGDDVSYTAKYYDTHVYNIFKENFDMNMTNSRVFWKTAFSPWDKERELDFQGAFSNKLQYQPTVTFWELPQGDALAVTEFPMVAHIEDLDSLRTRRDFPFDDSELGMSEGSFPFVIPAHEQVDPNGTFFHAHGIITFTSQTTGVASYIVYTVEGKKRVKLGEYTLGEFDLSKCSNDPRSTTEYPNLQDRLQYMHSFALTENYVILPLTSYLIEYCHALYYPRLPEVTEEFFFKNAITWRDEQNTRFVVMRRDTGSVAAVIETEATFITHQLGAYEKNGKIHIDMITYPTAELYWTFGTLPWLARKDRQIYVNQIERFIIDTMSWTMRRETLFDFEQEEFPTINQAYNAREYTFGYVLTGTWTQEIPSAIKKLNMQTREEEGAYNFPPDYFPSEPIFVSRDDPTSEDDGILLVSGFSSTSQKGFLVILSAKTMRNMAEITAPQLTPLGLHNKFFRKSSGGAVIRPGLIFTLSTFIAFWVTLFK